MFTNSNAEKLLEELKIEISTSQEVNFIFPFISKALINRLDETFKFCYKHNIKIRIISTTFDDLALYNNLIELGNLITRYSNIEIKVEDNLEKRSERIHIKASLFRRKDTNNSVIIGSSNLTHQGMVTGREWNVKLTDNTNKTLITEMICEFEKLWNEKLVDFCNNDQRAELLARIKVNQDAKITQLFNDGQTEFLTIKKYLYDFQKEIINCLRMRRKNNKKKHLIIMATGTGKTVVSAFDYLNQVTENGGEDLKILFLAHQREIIDQTLRTFRNVLEDRNFGTLMYEGNIPSNRDHLFATIQTMANRLETFDRDYFDVIIFDEAHHIAAKTFDRVFNYFSAKQTLGLTATPEREDGKSIKKYFNNEYAHELRIWEAINQKLLASFDYYCIDDLTADLQGVDLALDQEVFKKLNTKARNDLLYEMIVKYLGIFAKPTALIFCITTEHARIISEFLQAKKLRAEYLTSENSSERKAIISAFQKGLINYLCVVNMFNEGVDVPEINTIILLRPTNSKTVYLQQLGRGLRKTELKRKLEVYDLISNIDSRYDLTVGIKNLYHPQVGIIKLDSCHAGLPYNCTMTLEPQAQKFILDNLQKWSITRQSIHQQVRKYYHKYGQEGLAKLLQDNDWTMCDFYQNVNDFYLIVGLALKAFHPLQNDTKRNKNILKQFLFLDSYEIVTYFYHRLKKEIVFQKVNYEYDNLLLTSLLYEVTSLEKYQELMSNYLQSEDIIGDFITHHQIVVEELLIILQYKLANEELIKGNNNFTPLIVRCTFTVRQVLAIINRTNFLAVRGPLRVIAFQAGYLTFDKVKQVILADEDGSDYGKLTKYLAAEKTFYWSIPEQMSINHKIVQDIQNIEIMKYLFLQNKINLKYSNLKLKLYCYIGTGVFLELLTEEYITVKFLISSLLLN